MKEPIKDSKNALSDDSSSLSDEESSSVSNSSRYKNLGQKLSNNQASMKPKLASKDVQESVMHYKVINQKLRKNNEWLLRENKTLKKQIFDDQESFRKQSTKDRELLEEMQSE